ncbi:MAG: LEA type 2 family protein [Flavobacteriales bacterium]|nr:LEA type 2 family protein [Flavobacteriales bacterium]
MSKRRVVTIVIVLALILVALGIYLYQQREAVLKAALPELLRTDVVVQELGPDTTHWVLSVEMLHHLPLPIPTGEMRAMIRVEGEDLVESGPVRTPKAVKGDTSRLVIPLRVRTRDLVDLLNRLERSGADSMHCHVDLNWRMDHLPFARGPWLLQVERTLPAVRIPKVIARHTAIEEFGLREAQVDLTLHVFNPNRAELAFRDLEMDVTIDDRQTMHAALPGRTVLRAMDTTAISLPLDLRTGGVVKGLFDLVFRARRTPYSFDLRCIAVSQAEEVNDSRILVRGAGTLDDVKDTGHR